MTVLVAEPTTTRSNTFLSRLHWLPVNMDGLASMLGGRINTDDYGDGEVYHFLESDERHRGNRTSVCMYPVYHEGSQAVILDFLPGDFEHPMHDRMIAAFGDTSIPTSFIEALIADLRKHDALTTRTVLIADENGTEAVAQPSGWTMHVSLSAELAGTPTPVELQCFSDDVATPIGALPSEGVRLGRRTYPTVIDLERAKRAEARFLDLHEHAIESVLQQAALGVQHVYAILAGPLDGSQNTMCDDFSRHEAPEGFMAQFKAPGQEAEFLFLVTNVDGVITSNSHAL